MCNASINYQCLVASCVWGHFWGENEEKIFQRGDIKWSSKEWTKKRSRRWKNGDKMNNFSWMKVFLNGPGRNMVMWGTTQFFISHPAPLTRTQHNNKFLWYIKDGIVYIKSGNGIWSTQSPRCPAIPECFEIDLECCITLNRSRILNLAARRNL